MALESVKFVKETNYAYLRVLNQLVLPQSTEYLTVENVEEGASVIMKMQVRGAPAIAIVGCLSLAAEIINNKSLLSKENVHQFIVSSLEKLVAARPTAVNIKNAQDDFLEFSSNLYSSENITIVEYKNKIIEKCENMLVEDIQNNKLLGKYGANHMVKTNPSKKFNVLTHCNTGSLATGGYGTALGVIRSIHEQGNLSRVFFCETRPYNQGSRLTGYELAHDKIPSTLICDSMVGSLMASGKCDAVFLGADRIAINGDTANKIGTLQIAVLAKHYNIPFYVCAPISTVDKHMENGKGIVIEERSSEQMTHIGKTRIAASDVECWNPAFDVTPAELISAIVTEKGVFKPNALKC